jgi:aromatic-amino-acid transaminase
MFSALKAQDPDKILMLMQQFKDDPRDTKVDLGVGVYKDASGNTPVMASVKEAEHRLWEDQSTKSYVGLISLVLGNAGPHAQVAAAATPGGTGAVRQAFEIIRLANPKARVFVSDPTWPNHLSMLDYLGMERVAYRYFDSETRGVDFNGMIEDISTARAGDVVLLHGCCHNPTGANLNLVEWQAVIDVLLKTGAVPMVDIAYQGFGEGLDTDAQATRLVAASVPECLIAASCSKNFGIYRERTGLLMAVSQDAAQRGLSQDTLAFLNRQNYSFPPDHGARLVTMILNDEGLRENWAQELETVRLSMLDLRQALADELQRVSGSDRFGFLAQHRGMFSRLGTTPDLVEKMRVDYGIYMVGDSRMNIAGLNKQSIPILAKAIVDCGI